MWPVIIGSSLIILASTLHVSRSFDEGFQAKRKISSPKKSKSVSKVSPKSVRKVSPKSVRKVLPNAVPAVLASIPYFTSGDPTSYSTPVAPAAVAPAPVAPAPVAPAPVAPAPVAPAPVAPAPVAPAPAAPTPAAPPAGPIPISPPPDLIATLYRLNHASSFISYNEGRQIVVKLTPGPHQPTDNEPKIENPVKKGMKIHWGSSRGPVRATVLNSRVGRSNNDSLILNCIYIDIDIPAEDDVKIFYLTAVEGFQPMTPASLIVQGFQSYQNPYNSSPATQQSLEFRLGQNAIRKQVQNDWLM